MNKTVNAATPETCSAGCSNTKSLRTINPVFTIKGKPGLVFCSRVCRATVTHEKVDVVVPEAPRKVVEKLPAEPKPIKESKIKTPGAPVSTGRASNSPWGNLNGKMHITGKKPPNFSGNRKQVWEMIKEGMTVGALYELCSKAGLDGKSNLAKIIGYYGCVEVK